MTYGYEEPVAMPTMQVYDTHLAQMYVAGLKEQYEKAQQDTNNFLQLYNDFYSPIEKDNDFYRDNTVGKINKALAVMQANGIDPYRSKEGQAIIQRIINSVPRTQLAQMKYSAENARKFIESRNKLIAEGKWDPEFDAAVSGTPNDLANWSTAENGAWTRTEAVGKQSLDQLVGDLYDKLDKTEYIGPDTSRGADSKYYDLFGVSESTLNAVDNAALDRLMQENPNIYNYYLRKAEADAAAYNATHENASMTKEQALRNRLRLDTAKYWAQTESKDNSLRQQDYLKATYGNGGNGKKGKGEDYASFSGGISNYLTNTINSYLINTKGMKADKNGIVDYSQASRVDAHGHVITPWLDMQYAKISAASKNHEGGHTMIRRFMCQAWAPGQFADFMGRAGENKHGDRVTLDVNDVSKLLTADEVMRRTEGVVLSGYKQSVQDAARENLRSAMRDKTKNTESKTSKKSAQNRQVNQSETDVTKNEGYDNATQMVYTGNTVVVKGKDGYGHVYMEVRFENTNSDGKKVPKKMYMDSGFKLTDDNRGVRVNEAMSQGALQADIAASRQYMNLQQKGEVTQLSY